MRSACVPRVDFLVHEALLPKFPPPPWGTIKDYKLVSQQQGGSKSTTRMLLSALMSAGCGNEFLRSDFVFEVVGVEAVDVAVRSFRLRVHEKPHWIAR